MLKNELAVLKSYMLIDGINCGARRESSTEVALLYTLLLSLHHCLS